MSLVGRVLSTCLVVTSSSLLATRPAIAQTGPTLPEVPDRVAVEQYMGRYEFGLAEDRVATHGMGGRVMWRQFLGEPTDAAPLRRAALGLFAEYAGGGNDVVSMLHGGVQGDVSLLTRPLWGRIEPVVSLGLGVLRLRTSGDEQRDLRPQTLTSAPLAIAVVPVLPTRTEFAATVTPSLGVRVGLLRQLGVRADVRDVMAAGNGLHHHWSFTGGLSFAF